jgi:hypothetical protein
MQANLGDACMRIGFALLLVAMMFGGIVRAEEKATDAAKGKSDVEQNISAAVSQLMDSRAPTRDAAEKQLLELAGNNASQSDRMLALLPNDSDQMPLAQRDRLSRLRRQIEDRIAKAATIGTKITLSADKMPLADVLKSIEKQTGNRIVDSRDESDSGDKGTEITIELKDEPFWSAMDKILDQAKLGVNSVGGEDALNLVPRGNDDRPRVEGAGYEGPFRTEALQAEAERNLRQPKQATLKLQLEVAWEPRLRPIALSQPAADVHASTDDGQELMIAQPDALPDVDVPTGTQAAEIGLPFSLPDRGAKKIATLKGTLHALVPGRHAKFQFQNVTNSIGKSQSLGGVKITLDDIRKNGAVWEIHMRFGLDEGNTSLQSHRDWVLQNLSYLTDENGRHIENAGFESTRQTDNEVGAAYFFDAANDLSGLTWVYETPASIVDLPVPYELKNIDLP